MEIGRYRKVRDLLGKAGRNKEKKNMGGETKINQNKNQKRNQLKKRNNFIRFTFF